jgi:hypothetical protein
MPFPFEVDFQEIARNVDLYIDEVFSCLESEFLVMPKGPGFVEFPVFEAGYEALRRLPENHVPDREGFSCAFKACR